MSDEFTDPWPSAGRYSTELLLGHKVRLRALEERDLDDLTAWWNDPKWMAYQAATVMPAPYSSQVDMFRKWSENSTSSSVGFSIENTVTGELVGHLTLWGIDPIVRAATLGIIIGSPHIGQGFGADAISVLKRYAFDELALNKIELAVWEFNVRALRTYQRAGFVVEGRRRAAAFHDGRYWDQVQMGILSSEYLETR
ncbi:GNAT family N-acetyltransferase [Kocuria sp.]|uniref:GNAT family N-acetyltransferase n=1 Tax=Kocuria sp. TaxID=1871328 RepID=UPI0026DF91D4|nr:GNAT family protein [Kocuria sp.]MDO5617347.1 GNAT family protein [Kocuria sp.]